MSKRKTSITIKDEMFPNPFIDSIEYQDKRLPEIKCTLENEMREFSGIIREKPEWWIKMKDKNIISKWKKESEDYINKEAFQYILDELEYYLKRKQGPIEISKIDGIWLADNIIPNELKTLLEKQIRILENIPESERDYHPDTNNQVINLIHPSLYCLVYGKTKELKEQKKPSLSMMTYGKVIKSNGRKEAYYESKKFQWIPSEFVISKDGKVKIDSYINNLNPIKHKELYKTIGFIFEKFVPLFENVLTDLRNPLSNRITADAQNWYKGTEYEESDYDDPDFMDNRTPNDPDVPKYKPHKIPKTINLKGNTLQVIVKISNIILTPKQPKYNGGSWHVEGMKNESIVASGIYYWKSENITESKLSFRTAVNDPDYQQNDNSGVSKIYSKHDEDPMNQFLGSVITKEDRCICFPNLFQHQLQPFELKDKTRPGIRKILVFFLVDPNICILSTKFIPPQQKEWFVDVLWKIFPFLMLPREIIEIIVGFMKWSMTLEDAKNYRKELMKERKVFIKKNTEEVFERKFSLCEH
jgi:hypothetical protein